MAIPKIDLSSTSTATIGTIANTVNQVIDGLDTIVINDGTEAVKGIVQFANASATVAGTNKTLAVHPFGVKAAVDNLAGISANAAMEAVRTVYLGALPSDPLTGSDGQWYFNNTPGQKGSRIYDAGTGSWTPAATVSIGGFRSGEYVVANTTQSTFSVSGGFSYLDVYLNGVKLIEGSDYTTATPNFTITPPAVAGDRVSARGYLQNDSVDIYTKSEADSRFPLKTDVYTKAEIDTNHYTKAQANTNFYFKTEVDTNHYTKAQANTNFYFKSEVDSRLNNKANTSFVTSSISGKFDKVGGQLAGPVYSSVSGGAVKGTISTGTVTFNFNDGQYQTITNGGAHTWALSNLPASDAWSMEIVVTNGGAFAITFPTVNWLKGDGTTSTTFSDMKVNLQSSGVNTIMLWGIGNGTPYGRAG